MSSGRIGRSAVALVAGAVLATAGAAGAMAAPATHPATETTTPTTDSTTPTSTAAPVAPVVAAESITTLPLFGAPLTVDVSTTPGGAIASVDVESANATLTATKLRPNRVAFVTDTDTGKVRVETRHGGENVSVKAGSLADIAGTGGWSGDVFGTNTTTTVAFTIAANADGGADLTGITTSDATAVIGDVKRASGDHGSFARATITFTSGIQTRRLTITAAVFTRGDTTRAASQVSLSTISGTKLTADEAAGDHTWSGMLCDGATATVAYTVAADGTIAAGALTPATANSKVDGNSLKVSFSDSESVRIKVQGHDGNLRISVDPRLRCDVTTPSVNTPTSTIADDHGQDGPGHEAGDDHGDHGDHGDQGDQGGDHGGKGGHDDSSTSTTSTPATTTPTTVANG